MYYFLLAMDVICIYRTERRGFESHRISTTAEIPFPKFHNEILERNETSIVVYSFTSRDTLIYSYMKMGVFDKVVLEMDFILHKLSSSDVNHSMKGVLKEEMKSFFHFFKSVICTFIFHECNIIVHS